MNYQKVYADFSVVAITIALFLGFYLGKTSESIDPGKEMLEMISCNGYEIEFLKYLGFESRNQCKDLNNFLFQQYADQCLENIKVLDDKENYEKLVNLCAYHLVSKDYLSLSSEYFFWRDLK
ncbi:MAG: hypothetical protein V2A63_00495 [Patescibacteria group bacterium]